MADEKRRSGPHGPGGGQRHGYQKPKDMKGTVKKLLAYMGRYKGALALVAVCLVVSSGASGAGCRSQWRRSSSGSVCERRSSAARPSNQFTAWVGACSTSCTRASGKA